MYKCPECGKNYAEAVAICSECGAPFESAAAPQADKFCGECGAAIPDGAMFCGNCGAPVGTAVPAAVTAAPVMAVSATAPSAAPKGKIAITIGNIFFLLSLIPATIILLGDLFVFRATGVVDESFGYFGFSKAFNYLTDLVGILEGLGVDSLEYVRTLTSVFGFTWTVVIAALIFVAIDYIKGIIAANKGKLLYNICFMPLTYLAMSFLFSVIIYASMLYPINDVLNSGMVGAINQFVGFELSIDMTAAAIWLAVIAGVNAMIFVILKLVEKFGSGAR